VDVGRISNRHFIFPGLVLVCALALALLGCGTESSDPVARRVLTRAMTAMAGLKSLRESGSNELSSESESTPGVKLTFDSEMELASPLKPTSHTVIKRGTARLDVYSLDGYLYNEVSPGQWTKSLAVGTSSMSPRDLAQIAKGATNVRVASQSAKRYEIGFDVEAGSFKNIELLTGSSGGSSVPADTAEALEELQMSAVYTISKASHYVEKVETTMIVPSSTTADEASGTMTVTFLDFNKPVKIELPVAAKAATEK